MQTIRLDNYITVVEIDCPNQVMLGAIDCSEKPYKRQPCGRVLPFDLRKFPDAYVGQKIPIQ